MNTISRAFATSLAAVALGVSLVGPAAAQDAPPVHAGLGNSASSELVGAWTVDVTRRTCDTGVATSPIAKALVVFHAGGTLTEPVVSAARSASIGTWRRVGRDRFEAESLFLTYDGGLWSGSQEVRRQIVLSADAKSWIATVQVVIRDIAGTQVGAVCARGAATRFE
jgi:hypothetical protein